MEKGRISAAQVAVLTFMAALANSLLVSPTVAASVAKQDLWLSPLLASPIGFLIVLVLVKLNEAYPDQTLIQYASKLLGRPLGITIGLLYLFFIIHTTANALRQFTDLIKLTFLFTTPTLVVASGLLLVCAFAVHSGVEVVARLPMLLLPVVFMLLLMVYLPSIKDMDLHKLEPVLGDGLAPSLKGTFRLMPWIPVITFMNFYLPFVSNRRGILWWALGSVTIFTLTMLVTFVIVYAVIGPATSDYVYPFMVLARFTRLTEFFEHLESFVMMVWVVEIVIRITFGLYSASIGLAQCLRLPQYRPLVLPICMVIVLVSYWGIPNGEYVFSPELIIYYLLFGFLLPVLLLAMSMIRRLFSGPHNEKDKKGEHVI